MTTSSPAVPRGWTVTRLDRVASVSARIGWKALTADEYVPEGYVFLATPNIKSDQIDFENVNFITEFRYEESPELKLQVGDVLLSKDGTLGITNVIRALPRPATVNGSIAVIRSRTMVPAFLRYALASDFLQGRIVAYRAGMGVPHLFQADIKKFPLPQPPLAQQQAIADYLDAETAHVDRILAIRRAQAHLLELRLQALAHSLLSHSATPVQLRRVASIVHGASVPVGGWTQGANGIPFVTVADFSLPGNEAEIRAAERWTDDATVIASHTPTVPPGSVLFPRVGAALLTNARRIAATRCVVDNPILACIPWNVEPRYLFHWFRTVDLSTVSNPGPVPSVSERQVLELPIPIPSREEQRQIVRQLEIGLEKCDAVLLPIRRQVEALVERRQALITAGVTGQLAIPGVAA